MSACTIHRCVADTPELEGIVVVIDVFRASNTILAALDAGAGEVLLVAEIDQARQLRKALPGSLLLGERDGLMPPGFDGNNSPATVGVQITAGQTAILTTSAGTQALSRVRHAEHVVFASFANASAIITWIRRATTRRQIPVHLLAAGLCGREPALEDDLCADLLATRLDHHEPLFAAIRDRLLASPGADRLRSLGQHDDLAMCTRLDSCPLIPLVIPGEPSRAIQLGAL